jgi:hypothetical protein
MKLTLVPALLALALSSCAGRESAPPAAPAEPAPSAAAPAPSAEAPAAGAAAEPGAFNWDKMTKEERGKYMKEVVMPKMKEVFTAFDAKKYADMKCTTCHGTAATTGAFTMPNPELPQLPADMTKFKEWASKKPEMTKFMLEHVKPEMAKLLHEPEYSPETKTGFGCGECHTTATK